MLPVKKPVDELRAIGAPRELVEWVRKLPPEEATRRAWIDVTRPDWMPYIAVLRGITNDAIVRATCACVIDLGGAALESPEGARFADVLRGGRETIVTAEDALDDLRRTMLAYGDRPDAPGWFPWCKHALELGRAARRGNPLIGVALVLRTLVGQGGRRASSDLIARFRDRLLLA